MLLDPYQFQPTVLLGITRESAKAVSVQLRLPDRYSYQPGEHAVIRVPFPGGTHRIRQYSFSSTPGSGELWLTIVKTAGGDVSTWFVDTARVGDTIEISRPFAGPLVQKSPRGKICMIAGGSGIAPCMSHLRSIRESADPPAVSLLYSTRSHAHCFAHELSTPARHETITVRYSDQSGRLNADDIAVATRGAKLILVCGSRSFAQDMQKLCRQFAPDALVYAEAFTL